MSVKIPSSMSSCAGVYDTAYDYITLKCNLGAFVYVYSIDSNLSLEIVIKDRCRLFIMLCQTAFYDHV